MIIDIARFLFIADALNGTGGFRPQYTLDTDGKPTLTNVNATHLVRYPREGIDKFARRNQVAWYTNDLKVACRRFVNYLSKKKPLRVTNNEAYKNLIDDCNWRGDSLDLFWSSFSLEAKARGSMLLLVDMPKADSGRTIPYLEMIKPEQVIKLDVNERGLVSIIEVLNNGKIYGWNTTNWWIREQDTEIENKRHDLGICPVLLFSEGRFPDEGEFTQIADLSRRLFNLRSELDEILRSQTFSLLTYQIPLEQTNTLDISNVVSQIGTNNMLIHSGIMPEFIAPPDGPAKIYLDAITQIEEKIRKISYNIETLESSESGIALTIRFQQLNSSLAEWASRLQDLELRMWQVFNQWLNINTDIQVSWDNNYAITDMNTELNILAAMQASNFSDAVLAAKRQKIVSLDLGYLSDNALSELINAESEILHSSAMNVVTKENINISQEA